ncbi:hypothetical protein ACTXLT_03115 [Brachybacterium alimentarium]|uniref:hypothetical protein n=1 Tax=Brachybacterium alimentarium TaxID=47845 RepID=UPI00403D6A25
MSPDQHDIDRAILGHAITYALIEQDRDALHAALDPLGDDRESQLAAALGAVWAEMLPAYLAANPEAQVLADGRQLVDELTEWLAEE